MIVRDRRRLGSMLVAAALVSCGVSGQSEPTTTNQQGVRIVTPTPSTSPRTGTTLRPVALCFVSRDRLVTVFRELPVPVTPREALAALTDIRVIRGLPSGLHTTINEVELITATPTPRGVAEVELGEKFDEIPPGDQRVALAQVVCTLTGLVGIGQVLFTRQGRPLDVPRADSSSTRGAVSRSDYATLMPGP